MEPLHVTAQLAGPIALPSRFLALDALLISSVARRDNRPPLLDARDAIPLEIPVELEPGGRFYLASFASFAVERHDSRYLNQRFPLAEAQTMGGPKLRRIKLSAGATKSYRIPMETLWLEGDLIEWWCIGDADGVRELLQMVGYLGKKRSVGMGRVSSWSVKPCDSWEGFPVMRDGQPLRTLPPDWPGLVDPPTLYATLTSPYWDHTKEELCAVPLLS